MNVSIVTVASKLLWNPVSGNYGRRYILTVLLAQPARPVHGPHADKENVRNDYGCHTGKVFTESCPSSDECAQLRVLQAYVALSSECNVSAGSGARLS